MASSLTPQTAPYIVEVPFESFLDAKQFARSLAIERKCHTQVAFGQTQFNPPRPRHTVTPPAAQTVVLSFLRRNAGLVYTLQNIRKCIGPEDYTLSEVEDARDALLAANKIRRNQIASEDGGNGGSYLYGVYS